MQAAYLSDTFIIDASGRSSAVIETKIGKGQTIFLTTLDYPGNSSLYYLTLDPLELKIIKI